MAISQKYKAKDFTIPPVSHNESGNERVIGVEFEFSGIDLDKAAELIKKLYGGDIKKVSTYQFLVTNTRFGNFKLELDATILREKKYEWYFKKLGLDLSSLSDYSSLENKIKQVASTVVPFEIVTLPIPISELHKLDSLVDEMRRAKATGTGKSLLYAFGLHMNPEVPSLNNDSLTKHLKSFLLLEPWIRKDAEIDLTRRLTPFINEFDDSYISKILQPEYKPTITVLIDDYLKENATRNRSLDMLPVFKYIDPFRVDAKLSSHIAHLTSARPAFHYRLPNCNIDDPKWSLAQEWNRWVLVEQLANDDSLDRLCDGYLNMHMNTHFRFNSYWAEYINKWVNDARNKA